MQLVFQWIAVGVSIVGAFTSIAALVYAVRKGTTEWRRVHVERRVAKEADAAADALLSILRYTQALEYAANGAYRVSAEQETEPAQENEQGDVEYVPKARRDNVLRAALLEAQNARWEIVASNQQAFLDAWNKAVVYLPEPAEDLFNRVWKKKSRIFSSQDTLAALGRSGTSQPKIYEAAFGESIPIELESLRAEAKKLLRPIAQHRVNDADLK